MRKWILLTLFFVISVLVSIFVVNQNKKNYDIRSNAAAATSLSFQLLNNNIKVNDLFVLRVYISTGSNQTVGAQLNINYDPTKVKLNTVLAGTFYPNPTVIGPAIDNTTGKLSYTLLIPPGSTPVTGSGVLATLNFQTISQGIAKISFNPTDTLVIATGEGGQNVISSLSSISVNIRKTFGR